MDNNYIGSLYPSSGGGGSSGNDVWEITKISVYTPTIAGDVFINKQLQFVVYENGTQFNQDLWYVLTYANPYQGTPTINGKCTHQHMSSGPYEGDEQYTITFGGRVSATIHSISLYTDSNYTNLVACESFTHIPWANSISATDYAFPTANQVYNYVSTQIGNIETILASI